MALQKSKFTDVPKDGILLSEGEALKYQLDVIRNWSNKSDVVAIKYGAYVLGGASLLAGMYINNLFRSKLHLYNFGRMSTYLPACCIPAVFSAVLHVESVLSPLLLMKTECPVCVEMRASALQCTLGFIFPMIVSPVACLAVAQKYGTYDIPYITNKPLDVLKLLRKLILPSKNVLFGIVVCQAILGSAVTFLEAKSNFKVNAELLKIENDIEQSFSSSNN